MKTIKTSKHQCGIGVISLLLIVLISVSAIIVVIKLTPSYLENYTLKSVLQGVEQDFAGKKNTPTKLRSVVQKRLLTNNIRSVKPLDVRIIEVSKNMQIKIEYEVRKPLVGNISAVLSFSELAEVPN